MVTFTDNISTMIGKRKLRRKKGRMLTGTGTLKMIKTGT